MDTAELPISCSAGTQAGEKHRSIPTGGQGWTLGMEWTLSIDAMSILLFCPCMVDTVKHAAADDLSAVSRSKREACREAGREAGRQAGRQADRRP